MSTPTKAQTTDLDATEPPADNCACACAHCTYEAYNAKHGRLRWTIIHPDEPGVPPGVPPRLLL